MNHYQQSLVVGAAPAAVYAALTTPAGLRGWWTRDCDVTTDVGGTLRFRFGPHRKAMRIARLDPDREVRWLCTEAHIEFAQFSRKDEWVSTEIVFRLSPHDGGRTRLDFEHIGLVPAFECWGVCADGWRHFLGSLQQFSETGRGTPFEPAATAAAH
jgi:uncharacterized protein YndB with AHSA1/START domain